MSAVDRTSSHAAAKAKAKQFVKDINERRAEDRDMKAIIAEAFPYSKVIGGGDNWGNFVKEARLAFGYEMIEGKSMSNYRYHPRAVWDHYAHTAYFKNEADLIRAILLAT